MKKARRSSISRLDEEKNGAGFADLVERTLTVDRLETVLIEKGVALVPPEADRIVYHDIGPGDPDLKRQLDLHGMTVDEALRRVVYFLQNGRHQGLRQVRIVTGKGLHSDGEAVLPEAVEQTLLVLKRQGEIHSFQWQNGDRRRSGALLVRLLVP
ncbi:MAG: hypothetical protein COZ12_04760 [Deltaproteobacteria bacterium CG_4_10_14_3_um_filter_60_8]|nr:MAG: hypothetical protein AUK28_06515 [Desulfobacterales bacterium CG2_30_60_27]PIP43487.1 MAG: hypothetical protein COX17_06685 [Deltaproteobacteria bacterium CG23_combo_of_CG06-09_8_20_14_all_60_8]PIY21430.1 MAG: hypothetical protein COZ12_04760 [Deltaproteobacteria bacterium CG_4_10_14_3_um_filter_60_8]